MKHEAPVQKQPPIPPGTDDLRSALNKAESLQEFKSVALRSVIRCEAWQKVDEWRSGQDRSGKQVL